MKLGRCELCEAGTVHVLDVGDLQAWRCYCDEPGCAAYLAPEQRTVEGWDAVRGEQRRPGPAQPA